VTLPESGDLSFRLELAADADVAVVLRDAAGDVVRRIPVGRRAAGGSDVTWDGLGDDGARAAAGAYTVEVTALDDAGAAVAATTRTRAAVEGVRFVDGTGYLVVGGALIPLSDVVEVLAPSGA
jgi:flagellar basal-body rod modification protein FlgD